MLVKKFKYTKLNLKLILIKIKNYSNFYKGDMFQNLLSQGLREAGVRQYYSPNVLAYMAEFYSKRGDSDKGLQYINRAQKLAQETLDGLEVHKKYIKILDIKSQILQKDKKLTEALAVNAEALRICRLVFAEASGYWHKQEMI